MLCTFLNDVVTWFERISMLVILLNCITLGMYQPCVDEECQGNRCKILQVRGFIRICLSFISERFVEPVSDVANSVLWCLQLFDDLIFAFFSIEMTIKMVAMGAYGKGTYLADSWNRLDLFIVLAG